MNSLVDLDTPKTWPHEFREFIERCDRSCLSFNDFIDGDVESDAAELLDGRLVVAYHCTRLTKSEIVSVREAGLVPLSSTFTRIRLQRAAEDGEITSEQRDQLLDSHLADDENRAGQICLFTDKASLSDSGQIGWLVRAWGGEGINMSVHTQSSEFRMFESIGVPTVVIASLDLRVHGGYRHPGLVLSAIRTMRGDAGGTSIYSRAPIGPENIVSLEHPNGEFWSRFVWTPREGFR
jgi:hypothetical protein